MADPALAHATQFDQPRATILLVDCENDLAGSLHVAFERAHLATVAVCGSAQALQQLLLQQPDAVVVDIRPSDSGQLEFVRAISRRHRVLALTDDNAFGLDLTPSDCIPKPLGPQAVLKRLEPILSDADPRHSTSDWLLHEVARGRIRVTDKPAVELVVSYRTRSGDPKWMGPEIEGALAKLALRCVRRIAAEAERLAQLELVVDLASLPDGAESAGSLDIVALALATGLDETGLTQQILAEARGWVGETQLPAAVKLGEVISQVAAPPELNGPEKSVESHQAALPAQVERSPTQRPFSPVGQRVVHQRRARQTGIFVLVAAVGIVAYIAFPSIVGREPTVSVSGAAATSVTTPATAAAAQPIAVAQGPRSTARAVPAPIVATQTPPTSVPTRLSPTATTAPVPDPAERVLDFYRLLEQGDYTGLSLILSDHMRQSFPSDPHQLRQRTPSGKLTVLQAEVVQPEPSSSDATVAIKVLEEVPPPLTTQRLYVGTWHLVLGPSGWLLDEPDIHIE